MRRTQSVAVAVSVAITAAVLFALALTYAGAQDGLATSRERLGADLMVVPAKTATQIDDTALLFTGSPAPVYMDASVADDVAAVQGVERVSAQFYGQTLDSSCCSATDPARLIGYDSATDWTIRPWVAGAGGPDSLDATQVIVGHDVDGEFNGIMTILGRQFHVAGRLDPTGADLDNSVLMNVDVVRGLTSENENFAQYWDEFGKPDGLVSAVLVDVADGANADEVAAKLGEMPGVAVVQPSKVAAASERQLSGIFNIMFGAAALMAVAALAQVFARFFGLAWERRSELALYRALGASAGRVRNLIAGEALALVGGGVVVGLVLGAGLFMLVPNMLAGAGNFPFIVPGPLVWVVSALAVLVAFALVGFLAVAAPVAKANRIDPSSVMQAGDIE